MLDIEEKAFKLIKEKKVNCYNVVASADYKTYLYWNTSYDLDQLLSEKEYDFLKAVLS